MLRRKQRDDIDAGQTGQLDEPAIDGASSLPVPVAVVPHRGNPRLAAAADAVARNDLAAAIAAYDSSTTWDERMAITWELSGSERGRAALDAWLPLSPQHPGIAVAAGFAAVQQAWGVRGSGTADTASHDQWAEFHRLLAAAEKFLESTMFLDPSSPIPWVCLLPTGMGLSVPKEELAFRFEEGWKRAPQLFDLHRSYIEAITPKWGGSVDMVQNFINSTLAAAPLGSPLFALRAIEAEVLAGPFDTTRDELLRGSHAAILDAAAKSVCHPAMPNGSEHLDVVWARNEFAYALAIIGELEQSEHQHSLLAGRYAEPPWCEVHSDIELAVATVRAWAHENAAALRN